MVTFLNLERRCRPLARTDVARLVLVGLPGTGKTTVAAVIAQRWNCVALDTDDELASMVGVATAAYLRAHGEVEFRARELDALRGALTSDGVVATGAGVVTTEAARELIAQQHVVWLDCDDATLVTRVGSGDRPLLGDDYAKSIARLRGEREGWYEAVADIRVDASGDPEVVAESVLRAVGDEAL